MLLSFYGAELDRRERKWKEGRKVIRERRENTHQCRVVENQRIHRDLLPWKRHIFELRRSTNHCHRMWGRDRLVGLPVLEMLVLVGVR